MTRPSELTTEASCELRDDDAVAHAKTPDRSLHNLPPKLQRGKKGVLERNEKDGDEVTWLFQLFETMGTDDVHLASRLLHQIINVAPSSARKDTAEDANAAIAAVHGIAPKDTIEGMLAVQMVATHNAAMTMLLWGSHYDQPIRGAQRYVNLSTKLLRTFIAQLESLQRYRGKTTQQKVTVGDVHVNEGGQAIVGAVSNEQGYHRKS